MAEDIQPTIAEIKANYVDSTSLQEGLYGRPLILDRIFNLLVKMIDALQKCAAAQADRLNFLAAWQKAYTDEMNQIHAFTAANGDGIGMYHGQDVRLFDGSVLTDPAPPVLFPPGTTVEQAINASFNNERWIDGTGDRATKARTDMNTLNTNLTQQMQGNRQVISDDAKAMQTAVNQTNDAVQQQTDMATAILQQLSTILSSIFAGS